MIISASRRTDIPAFYSDWFFNSIKEGFVLVSNPMNPRQVRKVDLNPEVVDCIVFWTKNPAPIIDRLPLLSKYNYYFQFTLTPYGKDLEPSLPAKSELIKQFKRLSKLLGPQRVIWRYDPIIVTKKYSVAYHIESFRKMTAELAPYTRRCVISFVDIYQKNKKALDRIAVEPLLEPDMRKVAYAMANIARKNKLELVSCAEKVDLEEYGIEHGRCIDNKLIAEICGHDLDLKKDNGQRLECGCVKSVDIGAYHTCRHGCLYCYANLNGGRIK
jgi:DNA repair photolyase